MGQSRQWHVTAPLLPAMSGRYEISIRRVILTPGRVQPCTPGVGRKNTCILDLVTGAAELVSTV